MSHPPATTGDPMSPTGSRRPVSLPRLAVLLGAFIVSADRAGAMAAAPGTAPARQANRLVGESSPYLKMHAHNPVDWWPWGPEALAKAREEGKVIFLSIGYSSCYWCHVMERESFMDEEIANFLNEHFVCIKVDREERPDVDTIYMTAVQAMTGRGGWPLSVFLTPEAKPFFGGTYFPARDGDRGAATGFLTVLRKIHDLWARQPAEIAKNANQLVEYLRPQWRGPTDADADAAALSDDLGRQLTRSVQAALAEQFDPQYGGFGFDPGNPVRPKFPEPSNLFFLLSRARDAEDTEARDMLLKTLEQMQMGGIWDHLAGGFHRYSTDRFWRIPHFEKMLYDNGQLASVYTEAYLLTGRESLRQTVEELLAFVLREMRDPDGAFYTALDAESDQVEGKYYRWEPAEVQRLLGEDYPLFASVYGVNEPNFEGRFSVPLRSQSWTELAREQGQTPTALQDRLRPLRARLLATRNQRTRPLTDTKILVGWNGLMIRGLADAGRGLQQPRFVEAAERAADFLLRRLQRDDGRLYRTCTDGEPKLNAYLDDYAFLANGLLALHRATGASRWLAAADRLTTVQLELFWDEDRGGFYFTSSDHEVLIARTRQLTDGALPAGNSVAAENLLYLARALNEPQYERMARRTIAAARPVLERSPLAAPRLAAAWASLLD
jgi:uncharacterized protein YyaL (SSP411 family)